MSRAMTGHPPDVPGHGAGQNAWVSSSRFLTGAPVAGENPLLDTRDAVSAPIRLMVVDDDPRGRAAIAQTIALEADLMIVADAANRKCALASAAAADPSVALVDVLLPDD